MSEVKKGGMRQLMPATAELVDELRAMLGAAWVDGAIAAGRQAQREHARLAAVHGQAHADGWLARQRFPKGSFWAAEAGHEVGVRRG